MRWLCWVVAIVSLATGCGSERASTSSGKRAELRGDSSLVPLFAEAEAQTNVSAALLATVAYLETRLSTSPRERVEGHAPPTYGIMGIGTGGNVTLDEAARRAGITPEECAGDTRENIRAAAILLASHGSSESERRQALVEYGGEVLASSVLRLLAAGWKSSDDSGLSIEVVGSGEGEENIATLQQGLGFPGAIWNPAIGFTNASRGPGQINYVVIHTTQGSYGGTISWFKNPAAEASSHYVVRSSDGEITQMVDDADIAWHDACFNSESIGIEHEGFVDDPGTWYTEAMYGSSAKLTAWLCDAYGIPKDHAHILGHSETPDCSDHTDPGWGWNWDHYLSLVQSGGVTSQNCTTGEAQGCGNFGCGCVDHQCNGVFCPGTGCTAKATADCGAFGCGCVDGECSGAFCPGTGCTPKETNDCAAYGCGCVDHKCNGGFCDGSGCTAREELDCGNFGCGCVDHACNGVFCPGSGCTAKETLDCEKSGKTCKNHECEAAPSSDAGTGAGGEAGAAGTAPEPEDGGTGWSGGGGQSSVKPAHEEELPGEPNTDAVEGSCSCRAAGTGANGSALGLLGLVALAFVRRRLRTPLFAALALALAGCATRAPEEHCELSPSDPTIATTSEELSSIDCNEHGDTGYSQGNPFPISVVTVDGKPVETATANAYYVMAQAAAAAGVNLQIVSGFRTMAEQEYLYSCYVNCSCNNCNLAAKPGFSNHQSGHALDLNTSAGGVYGWLEANASAFGFARTVPSEPWHWEWWGGGPGGGPCGLTAQNCTAKEAQDCGAFGCFCVDHQCNGGFCPGTGCGAKTTADCGAFGCGCVDGACNGVFCDGTGCTAKETNDCAAFGCGCVDHECNGGACEGTGCTAKDDLNCGNFGCGCADHQCGGGFCPGSACTLKETLICEEQGQTCKDHACQGEPTATPGTGGETSGTGGSGETSGKSGTSGGAGGGWTQGDDIDEADTGGASAEDPRDLEAVDGSCSCRAGSRSARSAGGASALAFLACLALLRRRRFHPTLPRG